MKHFPGCNCLDCHAVKFESLWSCGCSLCQDRYRLEDSTPRRDLGTLGDQQAQDNRTAAVVPPMVLTEKLSVGAQKTPTDVTDVPGGGPAIPTAGRFLVLLAVLLLSGCASVGGGVGDVHGATRSGRVMGHPDPVTATGPFPTSPRTEGLPICGTEDPYLPDPCRIEIKKGEWLKVSNPHPSKPTKHHSKIWWLLITLVTF